jgi:hypothetical protein
VFQRLDSLDERRNGSGTEGTQPQGNSIPDCSNNQGAANESIIFLLKLEIMFFSDQLLYCVVSVNIMLNFKASCSAEWDTNQMRLDMLGFQSYIWNME